MKKKKLLLAIIICILVIIGIVVCGFYWSFFDIQSIQGEQVIKTISSPDGNYTITAFLNNGGATVDFAVLAQVKNNKTNKSENIHWQYKCETATIEWIDNETVNINGVKLKVFKDIYDYRRN